MGVNTMTEELTWVARYKDGSYHTQYNEDGSYKDRYKDLVRDKLFCFELWKRDKKELVLRVYFDSPDKKLIWRRRVYKRSDGTQFAIYLVGWQINVRGRNVQSVSVVFPDGHVEVIDRWRNDEFFHPPMPHDGGIHTDENGTEHEVPDEGEDWVLDLPDNPLNDAELVQP